MINNYIMFTNICFEKKIFFNINKHSDTTLIYYIIYIISSNIFFIK